MVLDALKQHLAPAPTRSAYPAGGECAVCWLVEGCHWVGKVAPMNRRTQTHRRFPKWLMVDGQMGMSTRDVSKGRENKSGISQPWKWTHFGGTSSTYKTPPTKSHYPGVGFKYLTIFTLWGKWFQFDGHIFQWVDGWLRPPSWSSIHLPIYPPIPVQEEVYHLRCCRVKCPKRKSPKPANDGWRGVVGRERDVNIFDVFFSFFFLLGAGVLGMMGWWGEKMVGKNIYVCVERFQW